jgi:hypothetical protein
LVRAAMVDVSFPTALNPSVRILSASRTEDFSKGTIAALFVLLMAVTSIPVLTHPWPPIADYINHLARMHIIASIDSDPDLARYYEVDWQLIPNLMMDLVVPSFERVVNIFLAGQLYTILSFSLILSATLALHRQLYGRWSALQLIAFPLLYNNVFLIGTMNYVFGIGLALWALVTWVGLRERPAVLRLSVSALFVVALFFCHLYAVGVYGVGLLAYELYRLSSAYARLRDAAGPAAAGRALPSLIADFVMTGLPFLPVLPLLMMSPTWGLRDEYYWELHGKLDGLGYVFEVYSNPTAFLLIGVLAFTLVSALRNRALSFHPFGLVLAAIGATVYMALPRVVFQTYMADTRLPISLAFVFIACLDLDFRNRTVWHGFVAAVLFVLTMRVAEVENMWTELSAGTESFRQSVKLLDRGAKVLVAYADPDGGDDVRDLGLVHADCMAIIERSALVTTAFTVVGKQILHARPEYRERVDTVDGTPPMINDLVRVADGPGAKSDEYWRRWTSDYDYLYVLFTETGFRNPDPDHLTEMFAGERFVLYRIDSSQVAVASKTAQ